MRTPPEVLQEYSAEKFRAYLQETIRVFARPEDTQPDAMQPVHGIKYPPPVVLVSFCRTGMPHGWGDADNPITQALREWDGGDHGPMEQVNAILLERLGVKIEPIATPNLRVDPDDLILSNMVLTGKFETVRKTLDDLG